MEMAKYKIFLKSFLTLCYFVLSHSSIFAQLSQVDLSKFCEFTNSRKLKKELKSLVKSNNNVIKYNWKTEKEREVLDGFVTEIISLTEKSIISRNPITTKVNSFQFELLRVEDSINYIRIVKAPNNIIDTKEEENKEVLHFRASKNFKFFENEFEKFYSSEVNLESIFNTNTTYGTKGCGFIPIPTKERVKFNTIIEKKDSAQIIEWAKSGNVELQLYGIEGIYELTKRGVSFDSSIYYLIKQLESRKGFVSYCENCIYRKKEIRNIIPLINAKYRKQRRQIKKKAKKKY